MWWGMTMTLYRAATDDYLDIGYSFAETRETAESYLDNPGFGGGSIYSIEIDDDPLDLTGMTAADVADLLGMTDPGAIGLDEWLPRTSDALDAIRELGHLWAIVDESYPAGTRTWIWCGTGLDDEPELIAD